MKPVRSLLLLLALAATPAFAGLEQLAGTWRGEVAFGLNIAGAGSAKPVKSPTTLTIDPTFKVTGSSPAVGCSFQGVVKPIQAADQMAIEIVLSGCRDERFNVPLHGVVRAGAPGQIALQIEMLMASSTAAYQYTMKGLLKH